MKFMFKKATAIPKIDFIIAQALGIDVECIDEKLTYQSISAWNSLRHVMLMVAIETEFDLKITDKLLAQLNSVQAIREFVRDRTIGAERIVKLKNSATLSPDRPVNQVVHRGLEGIYVDRSTITNIDGQNGVLEHCGYNIHDLVEQSSFEETTWLLLHGELPDRETLAAFESDLRLHRHLPDPVMKLIRDLAQAHPMGVLQTSISALGAIWGENLSTLQTGTCLIAQIPTLIAAHHAIRNGREPIAPSLTLSHAENFLYMLSGQIPSANAVNFIDKDLMIHADHSSNASAFAARIAIGCQSGLHAAIAAAISTFSGALHGGAAEKAIELIDAVGTPENAKAYVQDCLHRNQSVMGFGHRVYRTEDPRVRHLRRAAQKLSLEREDTQGFEILEAVVNAMKPYAQHGIAANVDLYAGLAYRLLGLPDDLAVPMFVAGRIAGWVAQSLEQERNNVLIRPLLHYVGAKSRPYHKL
jgi:citrate synthase